MTAAPQYSEAAAQAALDALLAKLNVGGAGVIKIFDGTIPANCEAADAGTRLATLTLSATAFPSSATNASPRGAKATASAITSDTNAAATGTAQYFRAYDHTGTTCVIQGNCGTSSADMILNTTSIASGSTVSCSSWTVTLPDGG
jgi:hypothetical protein